MTIKVWNKAFDELMKSEGGYVNDPNDRGSETKYGISKRAYPNLDIKNLTLEQAKDIYYKDYWCVCKCDNLPDAISFMVFDFCVNAGCNRAIKTLQKCVGVNADGVIGNQTIGACNSANVHKVIEEYTQRKIDFYLSIVERNPNQKHFLNGWINRVNKIEKICEGLCQ